MEWAKQDGRRAVLRHAVQIIKPTPKQAYGWAFHRNARSVVSAAYQPFAAITSLSAFERFVFVISVIEGLSQEECAALLKCSVEDVAIGRERVREVIAVEDVSDDLTGEMDSLFVPNLIGHQRCGVC
jgi:DNA-directed RNA polymerase specialized sigma24 family protein